MILWLGLSSRNLLLIIRSLVCSAGIGFARAVSVASSECLCSLDDASEGVTAVALSSNGSFFLVAKYRKQGQADAFVDMHWLPGVHGGGADDGDDSDCNSGGSSDSDGGNDSDGAGESSKANNHRIILDDDGHSKRTAASRRRLPNSRRRHRSFALPNDIECVALSSDDLLLAVGGGPRRCTSFPSATGRWSPPCPTQASSAASPSPGHSQSRCASRLLRRRRRHRRCRTFRPPSGS